MFHGVKHLFRAVEFSKPGAFSPKPAAFLAKPAAFFS
jgi:hypothetical protein